MNFGFVTAMFLIMFFSLIGSITLISFLYFLFDEKELKDYQERPDFEEDLFLRNNDL